MRSERGSRESSYKLEKFRHFEDQYEHLYIRVKSSFLIPPLPEMSNLSTKSFILSKFYTDEGGKKNSYTMVCPSVREIIHSLKLVDYLLVQADTPWNITISYRRFGRI